MWLICVLGLAACSTLPSPQARRAHADELAEARGWQALPVRTTHFDLQAYGPAPAGPVETLAVYIEGDGLAWLDVSTPSSDPTPLTPLGLKLALAHPSGVAAYVGRPCQYVGASSRGCSPAHWQTRRFAPEVIDAMDQALSALQKRWGARRLVLVGYSGGATVAALLAARHSDVARLVTVAGNLDHRAWTAHHRVSALNGSLNAADVASSLAAISQLHFVGVSDPVIPPKLAWQWPAGFQGPAGANVKLIDGFDHVCCWAQHWPSLMDEAGH